ncbi:MAG: histidine kinase [Candidatus Frackibacter sp. T328-2]|nr:MAG: histidine kinase [Candidatus Frackibacter sp. T328-2]
MFSILDQCNETIIRKIDDIKVFAIPVLFIITFFNHSIYNYQDIILLGSGILISLCTLWLLFKMKDSELVRTDYRRLAFLEVIADIVLINIFVYLEGTIDNPFFIGYGLYILRMALKYGKDLAYVAATLSGISVIIYQILFEFSSSALLGLILLGFIAAKYLGELAENSYLLRRGKEEMITQLRSQRHDFKNQLQVLFGLVKLKKYDRILEYLQEVNATLNCNLIDLEDLDEDPIIYSLLVSKVTEARELGIKLDIDLEVPLCDVDIPEHKMVRIISNLIDNAFDELNDRDYSEQPFIRLSSSSLQDEVKIVVHNNYSIIPTELQSKIFNLGFSTKQKNINERGFGLYITRRLIEKYKGSIKVLSNDKVGTNFIVKLPQTSKKFLNDYISI